MMGHQGISRRDFLRGTAAGLTWSALLMPQETLLAQQEAVGPPLRCGLIGAGMQGTQLLDQAARLPQIEVAALCDCYQPALQRASEKVGEQARTYADYRPLLEQEKELEAVLVATPTHTHLEICRAALESGKHVLCEVPLAVDLEEARTLARLGKESAQVFQVGLQKRTHPLYRHVLKFVRVGVLDRVTWSRGHWQRKQSLRRPVAEAQMERALNWKLYRDYSGGLITEYGLHQFDVVSWMLSAMPVAATGSGVTLLWGDGREVPDTVSCLLEYPGGVHLSYSASLTNSYEGNYEALYGTMGAIWINDTHGLLFKEADAPMLGWEVYARKEKVGDYQGIVLDADASKLIEQGLSPEEVKNRPGYNPFYTELEAFFHSIREGKKPWAGPQEGLQATVVAWKVAEAVQKSARIEIDPALWKLT